MRSRTLVDRGDTRSRGLLAAVLALATGLATGLATALPAAPAAAGSAADGVAAAQVLTGVAYAPPQPAGSRGHLLDLYLPTDTSGPTPLIIWTHGSGWGSENGRDGADVVAARFNPAGYAVAGVAIRSSGNAVFPGQLYDIKAAIRYLRANAALYRLDPARFGVMGESSGGWAAAAAASTGDVPALEGDVGVRGPSSRVQAAAPFYPPTDFLQMDRFMLQDCAPFNQQFGVTGCHADPRSPESKFVGCPITTCPDAVARANPITYLTRNDPPLLIVHGQQDVLVPWQQSRLLQQAATAVCGDATEILLPRGRHGQWNDFLTDSTVSAGAQLQHTADCRQDPSGSVRLDWAYVVAFFGSHLLRS